MEIEPTSSNREQVSLYRHSLKPEWGLALLVWERESKRGYRFEDGRLRIFKSEYYELLDEVDAAADRRDRLHAAVARDHSAQSRQALIAQTARAKARNPAITIDEQIAYFRAQYPDGFQGETWRRDRRGADSARPLKRHRDPCIARAQELLARERLDDIIERQDWEAGVAALSEALDKTDIVPSTRRGLVDTVTGDRARKLVLGLHSLLFGDKPLAIRFDGWVTRLSAAIGKSPGWQLATAPIALVFPEQFVCVRPSSFRTQAQWMAPRLALGKIPSAPAFERALDMTRRVRERLVNNELEPADMMDIYDFMVATTRPKVLEEVQAERSGTPA